MHPDMLAQTVYHRPARLVVLLMQAVVSDQLQTKDQHQVLLQVLLTYLLVWLMRC